MLTSDNSLAPEDELFILVNGHPQYSSAWAKDYPKEAEKLIEEIRIANNLHGVAYQLVSTQNKVAHSLGRTQSESPQSF